MRRNDPKDSYRIRGYKTGDVIKFKAGYKLWLKSNYSVENEVVRSLPLASNPAAMAVTPEWLEYKVTEADLSTMLSVVSVLFATASFGAISF